MFTLSVPVTNWSPDRPLDCAATLKELRRAGAGRVFLCVCRSVEEVAEKFHAGDVLVVPYTTNELLPYLRDAAAIICEEGSAECHAATVGLLLSKPVLVGAGDATRRLEDGVRVSVDCARGVVQTMPQ